MDKVNLDAPAFGEGSKIEPKPEEIKPSETPAEPIQEPPSSVTEEKEDVNQNLKVPMWRFNEMYYQAMEAGRASRAATEEANRLKERYEDLLRQQAVQKEGHQGDLPSYWMELYGDSDASRRAFRIEQDRISSLEENLKQQIDQKIEQRQVEEIQRVSSNVDMIDTQFESLNASLGRELSDDEQSALLDIVDEYTPKDSNGDYLGGLLSFDKAWQIYELQQQTANQSKVQARNPAAQAIASSGNAKDDSLIAERNKNFNPLNWNAWKDRI